MNSPTRQPHLGSYEKREYPWGNERPDPSRLNCRESGIGHPTAVGIYALGATPDGVTAVRANSGKTARVVHYPSRHDKNMAGFVVGGGFHGYNRDETFRQSNAGREPLASRPPNAVEGKKNQCTRERPAFVSWRTLGCC
jgi:hypothetical protein